MKHQQCLLILCEVTGSDHGPVEETPVLLLIIVFFFGIWLFGSILSNVPPINSFLNRVLDKVNRNSPEHNFEVVSELSIHFLLGLVAGLAVCLAWIFVMTFGYYLVLIFMALIALLCALKTQEK